MYMPRNGSPVGVLAGFCVHFFAMSDLKKVVVGVAGGIAAYKACQVVRDFREQGIGVRVIPTANALKFVGAATFEALSGAPVDTDVFSRVDEVQHVRIGQDADAIVVAPATADFLARVTAGRADDLLTSTLLMATCPVVLAPAMHTEMWNNPATQHNVAVLRSRGYTVLEPAHGRLTGKDSGAGRLLDPSQIVELTQTVVATGPIEQTLEGKRVLISAGGTREPLDPVRFLGNHSSGKQGFALAEVAAQRGAEVDIVAGATSELSLPAGARVHRVTTAQQMNEVMRSLASNADIIVMAAAVADMRPRNVSSTKLKKDANSQALTQVDLVPNPDILHGLGELRKEGGTSATIVGFAAETDNELENARRKLKRKGVDGLMVNSVAEGAVFGQRHNQGWFIDSSGGEKEIPRGTKLEVAVHLLDTIESLTR